LTLQTLSSASRVALEQVAFRAALRVGQLCRLYSVILDEYRLRAALVEAKLRGPEGNDAGEHSRTNTFFVTGN